MNEKIKMKMTDLYKTMSEYERFEWDNGNLMIAGLDEVGRGPLAGPVVAAACILNPEDPILGVNDSKQLTEKRREELYTQIMNRAVCYSIICVEPDVIDEVNILNATKMAMAECVRTLRIRPDKLLIDAIDLKDTGIPVIPIIRGDCLSVSIAAASIIAKVTRDRIMVKFDEVYPGYGFVQNKGYGTDSHFDGIRRLGITPIHRRSFLKALFNENS
ncbi:MAG: ribonuclease HII [Saccharofermentanales bacterium]